MKKLRSTNHQNRFAGLKRPLLLAASTLILLMSVVLSADGQEVDADFFRNRDFNQYFWADHYAPTNRVALGAAMGDYEYDIAREPRNVIPMAEPVLGTQIPIYYRSSAKSKFAISVPISFSVMFDFTEIRTAPIVNTDYRFAVLEFNYSHLLNSRTFRNIGFKFIPFFHESTHLGDEITIVRVAVGVPTTRINLSYETFEFGVVLNDSYGEVVKNHQFGLTSKFLWNPHKGYYSVDTLEVASDLAIERSKRSMELDFNYQYQNPDFFLSNKRMMFTLSQYFQYAVRLGYPYYYRNHSNTAVIEETKGEGYELSSNTLLGWQMLNKDGQLSGLGVFFRAYFGRNYHGQFRNIPRYPWTGVSIIFDPSLISRSR